MSDTTPPAEAETPEQMLTRARNAAQAKRNNEAIGICDDLLALKPGLPAALALKGTIHAQRGDIEVAIDLLEKAIAQDGSIGGWHANICALYRLLNRTEDAVRSGREAVRQNPNSPQYLLNLALALIDQEDRDQAVVCLLRAIGQSPKDASAHLALGQILLARGEMAPGWIEYEWRNETEAARGTLPRMTSAQWNGMKIPGRVLLVGDQGYGDTIQFARYIPMAAERCAELIVGCSPELAPLLSPMPGVKQCLYRWDEIPPHAVHARLSSLPFLLGTDLSTIPSPGPYLAAPPGKTEAWAEKLAAQPGSGPRVGLVWTGRPTHPNDRRRSIRLDRLRPVLDVPGVRFVSLQKPLPDVDRPLLESAGILDVSDDLADFGDTAGALMNIDLLVTIDTGVAHLAGALGRPVWMMTPQPADWRWMLEREDSVWYRSMRLFRQTGPGEWEPLIAKVAEALAETTRKKTRRAAATA